MGKFEENFIIENYNNMSIRKLSEITGINRNKISNFLKSKGLTPKRFQRLTDYEKSFIEQNYYKGYKYLSEKLNKPISTIKSYCNRNSLDGCSIRKYNDILDEISSNKNKFIKNLYSNSMEDLSLMYGTSKKTLYKIMKELNIKNKQQGINEYNLENTKYKFDENYFKTIDSGQKAYFLGLIASDGCIYIPKDNRQSIISITLLKEDGYILDFLYNELKLNKHPITATKENRVYSNLQISSNIMANDLNKYGIIPNKTYNGLNIRNIPIEYYKYFLLGYFDGDGSINVSKENYDNVSSYYINICGIETAIESLETILNSLKINFSFQKDNRKYDEKCGVFGSIVFENTIDKYIFLKEIYNDDSIVCLKRKKYKAIKLIYNIENNTTNRKENIIAIKEYEKYKNAVLDSNI